MAKQEAIDCLRALPDNADWEEILYSLYVIQRIEKGLKEAETEEGFTTDEVRKELGLS